MNRNRNSDEDCLSYNYSFKDKFRITKSNIFWKTIDYIACKIKSFAKLYENTITKEYERESKLFNISKSKNILHIGCGSYPVTAITLAKINGCKVVAIDNDPRAIKLANKVITRKKMEDRIAINIGDGRTYPIKQFDTIIISSCSVPKIEILNNIFRTAKINCKIIVREIYGPSEAVVDCINNHENIKILRRIGNHPFPTSKWESFYLIKNN